MLSKLIKKFRARNSKNKSFSLLSKSRKCKTKRASIKIKLNTSDKNNRVLSDNSNNKLKKIIKFLSPKTDKTKKKEVQVDHESINAYSKNSQDSGWVEMTRSSSRSSMTITRGNFSTSSPVFGRKQFDNFCINYGMSFEVEAIPKIDCIDIEPIEMLNKSDLTCSTINSEETGINLHFDEPNSTIVNPEVVDFLRANSDSEILPLEAKEDSNLDEEFTSNYNVLSQSFPATCNSTRRESNQKLLKCIVGMRFAHEFTEKSAEESSIFVDQNLFASFDQSFVHEAQDQKKTMRDTLVEISMRRLSFSDNGLNSSRVRTSSIGCNFSNDNVNISLPKPESYECGKTFELVKISEGVEVF